MATYELQWITDQLAVGPAPLSYEDLAVIRKAGIVAIVNLGSEIAELSAIEREQGFEVHFLPVEDDSAPDAAQLEIALEWLDEALYLNKKVLVHCRFGIGRTGTFVTGYLIRRGFGLKLAERALKGIHSVPTSYAQWQLLRKYDRATPALKVRKPDLRSRRTISLEPFFADYERILADLDECLTTVDGRGCCGSDNDDCCHDLFDVTLIEAAYLHHAVGSIIDQAGRREILERLRVGSKYVCALNVSRACLLYAQRPVRCRFFARRYATRNLIAVTEERLLLLSRQLFLVLTGTLPERDALSYSMTRVLTGAFVQDYFAEALRVGCPPEDI